MADEPNLVKKKVRIRGGHRGYVKQVITQAKESLVIEKSPENVRLLKQYKATLVDKLHELKSLDSEIAELLPDDETIDNLGCSGKLQVCSCNEKMHHGVGVFY